MQHDEPILLDFFDDLSALFEQSDLPDSDIWVAGSYARGEQKGQIVDGKILSASDMELLVIARQPAAMRTALKALREDLDRLIARYFSPQAPLDFDYWVVSTKRFHTKPCVLFHDAILADRPLHKGLCKRLPTRLSKFLMRDLREILIHRAANQFLFGQNDNDCSVVARNILDLLTVHCYSRGQFLPTYSARIEAIDQRTRDDFGDACASVFSFCLSVKLGVASAESNPGKTHELENFLISGLENLCATSKTLQETMYSEDNLNYSGARMLAYRAYFLLKHPFSLSIVMTTKQTIFSKLISVLKSRRTQVPQPTNCLRQLLLANYPYLSTKIRDA